MNMVKMVVKSGVVVVRDGQRVRPAIGEEFDFTAAERDDILRGDPRALVKANEDQERAAGAAAATATQPSAEGSQARASGGRKKATANKSDAELAAEGNLEPDTSKALKKGEGDSAHADEEAAAAASDDDL